MTFEIEDLLRLLHQSLADGLAGLYIAINGAGFNLYPWQHVAFTKA